MLQRYLEKGRDQDSSRKCAQALKAVCKRAPGQSLP